jgi:ribonuclease E
MPEPEPAPAPVAAAEPEPAETVVQGPVVQPVSIDSLDEAAPRRRGWWKR